MERKMGVLPWLAEVLRERREAAGKRQVHFAAAADVDQATVARFEQGKAWPRDFEELISVYAELTGDDEIGIWRAAIDRWANGRAAGITEPAGSGEEGAPGPPPGLAREMQAGSPSERNRGRRASARGGAKRRRA